MAEASHSASLPSPFPQSGRNFSTSRKVRLGDVTPKGRVRLDAVARYLQDIATDDSLDGNYSEPHSWVVRRTQMWVTAFPKYLDEIVLTTWCGALGSHWAERRTQIKCAGEVVIEAAALWVRVDFKTMKPVALSKELTNHSLPEIGDAFGGRDHTTVLHACRKIESLKEETHEIKEDFQNLIRTLSS